MMAQNSMSTGFELRFNPLFGTGLAYSFPCDASAHVDLDHLGERARCNYFYARTLTGRELGWPAVQRTASQ